MNVTSGAETLSSPGRGPGLGSQRTRRVSGYKHNAGRGAARLDRGEGALLELEAGGRLAYPPAPGSGLPPRHLHR